VHEIGLILLVISVAKLRKLIVHWDELVVHA